MSAEAPVARSVSRPALEPSEISRAKAQWASRFRSRVAALSGALSLAGEEDAPTPATDDE